MLVLTVDVEPDFPPYLNTNFGLKGLKVLVEMLRAHRVGATFFVCAGYADENPEVFSLLSGFEIGCHGLTHEDYSKKASGEIEEHLVKAIDIFKSHGVKPTGFRAPYARYSKTLLDVASRHFMYDSSKTFWHHEQYEVHEFPLFTGGKMFGMHPFFFNRTLSFPLNDKIYFTHPWEYGGVQDKKIYARRGGLRLFGYSMKNYKKNLEGLLKKKPRSIIQLIKSI